MPNSKGDPDYREKNHSALEKKFRALQTPFEKYLFLNKFASAASFKETLPSIEETFYRLGDELARELQGLSAEQREAFETQVAEWTANATIAAHNEIKEFKQRLDDYNANPQGDPPAFEVSDSVVQLYGAAPTLTLMNIQYNEMLSTIFLHISEKANVKYMEVWTNPGMTEEEKDEAIAQELTVIEPVTMGNPGKLQQEYGIPEATFTAQRMAKQKESMDAISPESNSAQVFLDDLKDKWKGLKPDVLENLPGNAAERDEVYNAIANYIAFFESHPGIDLRTAEGSKQFTDSKVDHELHNKLTAYLNTIPQGDLTEDQLNSLQKLDNMVRPLIGDSYRDMSEMLKPRFAGYENLGTADFQVKYGAHGTFNRTYVESNGVWLEEYKPSESLADPKGVTLPDGRQGLLHSDEPFDMRAHLENTIAKLVARKPSLAPYLKLNEEELQPVLNPGPDQGTALNDFQSNFDPNQTIGVNKRYALPTFAMTAERFFLPGPHGQNVTNMPEFAEEFQGFLEEFYAAASTQRMLHKAKLLDENGKVLSGGSAHEAMGEIADLLGLGDMVAPSERIPTVKDGKTVFATFVPKVDGKSILDPPGENIFLDKKTNPLTKPEGFKALSNMQVLDFLCGTYNSMISQNITIKMDPAHPEKVGSLVRHAHGTAFGTLDPNNADHFENEAGLVTDFTRPSALKVVTRSVADRVLAMTDDDIRKCMENKGFKQAQVDAAVNRLHVLQEKLQHPSEEIKEGSIHIMEDEEWVNKDPNELMRELIMSDAAREEYRSATPERQRELDADMYDPAKTTNTNNIFRKALATTDQAKTFVKDIRQLRGNLNPSLRNVKGYVRKQELASLRTVSPKDMENELERNDPWYASSSDQFKAMKKAMADYNKKLAEFGKQWKRNGGRKTPEELRILEGLMEKVGQTADAYVSYKDRTGVRGRSGPGRYAYAKQLQGYAHTFKKQMERSNLQVKTDRKMESIRRFYRPEGPGRELANVYIGARVINEPEQLDILEPVTFPTRGLMLAEDDFASIAYTIAFHPELTGDVRRDGISLEELSREQNVIANNTLFTTDLGMKEAGGDQHITVPRESAFQYFPLIQKARHTAGEDLRAAAGGSPEDLGKNLAVGLETYVKAELQGNQEPMGADSMTSAKMVHQTIQFLERNPKVLQAAKLHGLKDSTIQMIKAKYHAAELHDRNEIATKKLAAEAAGTKTLTPREKAECKRDQKMYQILKDAVNQEMQEMTNSPEYQQRVEQYSQQMAIKLQEASHKPAPIKNQEEYLLNSKFNLIQRQGLDMPKAMLSLANGLGKLQQHVEKLMQQPQAQPPVVDNPVVQGPN
jgi:hypothetical protein